MPTILKPGDDQLHNLVLAKIQLLVPPLLGIVIRFIDNFLSDKEFTKYITGVADSFHFDMDPAPDPT